MSPDSPRAVLMRYALKILGKRAYTVSELRRKLIVYGHKKKYPTEEVSRAQENLIAQLQEWHYLDDRQYAAQFIRSRLAQKPKSLRIVQYELMRKGVNKTTATEAMAECQFNERALAERVMQVQSSRLMALPDDERRAKIYRLLKNRGFSGRIVGDIVETFFRA